MVCYITFHAIHGLLLILQWSLATCLMTFNSSLWMTGTAVGLWHSWELQARPVPGWFWWLLRSSPPLKHLHSAFEERRMKASGSARPSGVSSSILH